VTGGKSGANLSFVEMVLVEVLRASSSDVLRMTMVGVGGGVGGGGFGNVIREPCSVARRVQEIWFVEEI
jgi:hypothetical protein